MSDPLQRIEERRLALGLSQRAVAERLGITQPHYSKIVCGLVRLTPQVADAMHAWIAGSPAPAAIPDRRAARIRSLTRAIQRQLRELAALAGDDPAGGRTRVPRSARRRE